jgi:hypothetical protein
VAWQPYQPKKEINAHPLQFPLQCWRPHKTICRETMVRSWGLELPTFWFVGLGLKS